MYKEITTLEIALKNQKEKIPDMSMLSKRYKKGLEAFLKLQIIVNAVNNDNPSLPEWKPDYNDTNQPKWFPSYVGRATAEGFKFNGGRKNWINLIDGGGSRLALKDQNRCHHMDEYFRELYKDSYMISE